MLSVLSTSAQETKKLGENLGRRMQGGEALVLFGNLGSGKTTFVKGLARGLGCKEPIVSPTFLLAKSYPLHGIHRGKTFHHLDLYRLRDRREVLELGLLEILHTKNNIVAIEWPAMARKILPARALAMKFEHIPKQPKKRLIHIWLKK